MRLKASNRAQTPSQDFKSLNINENQKTILNFENFSSNAKDSVLKNLIFDEFNSKHTYHNFASTHQNFASNHHNHSSKHLFNTHLNRCHIADFCSFHNFSCIFLSRYIELCKLERKCIEQIIENVRFTAEDNGARMAFIHLKKLMERMSNFEVCEKVGKSERKCLFSTHTRNIEERVSNDKILFREIMRKNKLAKVSEIFDYFKRKMRKKYTGEKSISGNFNKCLSMGNNANKKRRKKTKAHKTLISDESQNGTYKNINHTTNKQNFPNKNIKKQINCDNKNKITNCKSNAEKKLKIGHIKRKKNTLKAYFGNSKNPQIFTTLKKKTKLLNHFNKNLKNCNKATGNISKNKGYSKTGFYEGEHFNKRSTHQDLNSNSLWNKTISYNRLTDHFEHKLDFKHRVNKNRHGKQNKVMRNPLKKKIFNGETKNKPSKTSIKTPPTKLSQQPEDAFSTFHATETDNKAKKSKIIKNNNIYKMHDDNDEMDNNGYKNKTSISNDTGRTDSGDDTEGSDVDKDRIPGSEKSMVKWLLEKYDRVGGIQGRPVS